MRGLALILALVLAAAGCGPGGAWPKTAGETSCAEWLDQMSLDQRMGLGRGILAVLWNKDGAAQDPPEDKVTKFANAIGGVCANWPDEKVSTVGAGLYLLSSDVKP